MRVIRTKQIPSPIGPLTLCSSEQGLCGIEFGTDRDVFPALEKRARQYWEAERLLPDEDDGFLQETAGELEEYFGGRRRDFRIPLDLRGTPFQIRVWEALARIPFGEVRSYKQVAEAVGSPKAVRAVGGANNKNPVPLIIPCHRVIGAGGDMVGYGGGLEIKRFLLEHEGFLSKKSEHDNLMTNILE